jgi:hypothetical protein
MLVRALAVVMLWRKILTVVPLPSVKVPVPREIPSAVVMELLVLGVPVAVTSSPVAVVPMISVVTTSKPPLLPSVRTLKPPVKSTSAKVRASAGTAIRPKLTTLPSKPNPKLLPGIGTEHILRIC